VHFDPFDSGTHEDPYPLYESLRDTALGVHSSLGMVVVSRYEDVVTILADGRFGRSGDRAHAPSALTSLLDLDPPAHTRLRRLATRILNGQSGRLLRPRIEHAAADLLRPLHAGRDFDLIHDFARPLPGAALTELLGIPPEERPQLLAAIRVIVDSLEGSGVSTSALSAASEYASEYLATIVTGQNRSGAGTVLSSLVSTEGSDNGLTVDELVALLTLFLVAGTDTTTSLIGNAMVNLVANPDRLRAVQEIRDFETIVDELIRFDGPVQFVSRVAVEPARIGAIEMQPGTRVLALLGAANRDPAVFDDPGRLHLQRSNSRRHLGFGYGPHYCLGAALARTTAAAGIGALLNGGRVWEWMGEPKRDRRVTLRSWASLPVQAKNEQDQPVA
jgi:cytochrome P450